MVFFIDLAVCLPALWRLPSVMFGFPNNALASKGWKVLRFNTYQIREEMTQYCVPKIAETVNQLGGLEAGEPAPSNYIKSDDGIAQQLSLFDGKTAYATGSEDTNT